MYRRAYGNLRLWTPCKTFVVRYKRSGGRSKNPTALAVWSVKDKITDYYDYLQDPTDPIVLRLLMYKNV